MTVQLALRKSDTRLTSRFISWWTNSRYSHCELVVNGVCYSSSVMDKGVRAKEIDMPADKWDVIDIPWADAYKILEYFVATDGHTYGWTSLITSQMFNMNKKDNDSQFCSEWCAAALDIPNSPSYNPESLADIIKFISYKYNQ